MDGADAGNRPTTGSVGEDAAAAAYERDGFQVAARNWRCPAGEIDLVLVRPGLVVICEVKARRGASPAHGAPFEAVTGAKQRRLRGLAAAFLAARDGRFAVRSAGAFDVRFDVASVSVGADRRPAVHIFDDAF